ncbi:MAG: hypothetical protein ACF8PN_11160 [Phycisphaerales bacterium]
MSTPNLTGRAELIDLGLCEGGESWAHAINARGEVVGGAFNADGREHAFLYRDGEAHDLGTLGGNVSYAFAINDAGRVVGESRYADFDSVRGFLWHDGEMQSLGALGGLESSAHAISERGHIVGHANNADRIWRAFLWTNQSMRDIGALPDRPNDPHYATGVNSQGVVVGEVTFGVADRRPFIFRRGELKDLNLLTALDADSTLTSARAINDAGVIAGAGHIEGKTHAVLLEPQGASFKLRDLGTLGGSRGACLGISPGGLAVGYSDNAQSATHAFALLDGEMIDLNSLIDPASGWELVRADDANDEGWIVGHAFRQGVRRAFLLKIDRR